MKRTFGQLCLAINNHLIHWMVALFRMMRSRLICRVWGFETEGRVIFAGPVFVRVSRPGSVILKNGVRFFSTPSMNAICQFRTVIDTRKGGVISIGEGSGLSSVMLSSKSSITIGQRVLIGANTQIYDHNFHALQPADRADPILGAQNIKSSPIVIEDDCFIGANCIILKGTHVGAGSLVAAGSVVFGLDIPQHSLVRGNPAKVEASSEVLH